MDRTGDLLTQLQSGDRRAVEGLLEMYLPELHAFLRLRMGPAMLARESSEDLAQSLCREVLEALDSDFEYRGDRAFKAWLFLRAQRKLGDRARFHHRERRDVRREQRMLSGEQMASGYRSLMTPSREAVRNEELEKLDAAFAQLPDDYREVVTCAKFLGLTHEEIAERMGRSVGATRVLLHRGLVRLAFLLEAD